MFKKMGLLQVLSFVVIAGLVVTIIVMQASPKPQTQASITIAVPTSTTASSIPQTGGEAATGQEVAGNSFLSLPDGSTAELLPGTELEVASETGEYLLNLSGGGVLIMPALDPEAWFTVITKDGFSAKLQGCAMAMKYDPDKNSVEVDCISGYCEVQQGTGSATTISTGTYVVFKNGIVADSGAIDAAALADSFTTDFSACPVEAIPQTGGEPTATPTAAKAPASDTAATATAACKAFQQQFPSTPCP